MALITQGTQRIEVIVRKEAAAGMAGAETTEPQDAGENKQEKVDGENTMSAKRRAQIAITNITHSASTAYQVGMLYQQYYMGGLQYKYGDAAVQDSAQRTVEVITDGTNFALQLARGIAFGRWGGPIGMAVGAATAVAASVGTLSSKYATRAREYNYKMFKEENGIEYKRARAGINLTTGRLR